jgi:hypothetical protein
MNPASLLFVCLFVCSYQGVVLHEFFSFSFQQQLHDCVYIWKFMMRVMGTQFLLLLLLAISMNETRHLFAAWLFSST